jgi:TonB family protein
MNQCMQSLRLLSISTFALMLMISNVYSQHTVYKDTINIRGYVYDNTGKPVNKLLITSKQWDLEYNRYRISSSTDSTGYFELMGAKPNDTLTTDNSLVYDGITYMNKGSRFMIIYLPPLKHTTDAFLAPPIITISHKRKRVKKLVAFNIKPDSINECYFGLVAYPEFGKGKENFTAALYHYLQYPQEALENNVEGIVRVTFTVQKDGILSKFKIMNGLGYGCDTAVINAIKASGKWRPAIKDGKHYAFNETIAVEFKLTNK